MIWARDIGMPKTARFRSDERACFAVRSVLDIGLSQHYPAAPGRRAGDRAVPPWFKEFFRTVTENHDAVPGVINSIQTYGRDLVSFYPHLHCLASDGCFCRDGQFHPMG